MGAPAPAGGGGTVLAFRFWRRIRIAPGLTLNLSKSGASVSFGGRGARYTVGPRGRRVTLGMPGTGLFYTRRLPDDGAPRSRRRRRAEAGPDPSDDGDVLTVRDADRLSLGFLRRFVTPDDEEALVDGCRELLLGREDAALARFESCAHLPDGAFLAGFLSCKRRRFERAVHWLEAAVEGHRRLGRSLGRYGIGLTMSFPVTGELMVHVEPGLRGALLGLAEAYQWAGRRDDALACLERLVRLEPGDVVVKVSLAELLLDGPRPAKAACRRVVHLAGDVENETPVHAALMLYKARALHALGLDDAAREVLTRALRRRRGRSAELRHALRYERARVYESLGRRRRARADLERIYAEDPDYEDVARRLGL